MKICDHKKLLKKINNYDPDEYWCMKKQSLIKICSRCRSYINLKELRKETCIPQFWFYPDRFISLTKERRKKLKKLKSI